MSSPSELKAAGNARMQAGELEAAVELYDEALQAGASREERRAVLTNRALALFRLGRFEASLRDGRVLEEEDPAWIKGYYHQVRALQSLQRFAESHAVFLRGLRAGGEQLESYRTLEKTVLENFIAVHYNVLTADLPVRVAYLDQTRGKGLVAKRRLRMFQPIFTEEPLLSHQKLPDAATKDCCMHCLRSFVTRESVGKTRFAQIWSRLYPEPPKWVWCERCEKRAPEMEETDPKKIKDPFLRGNPFFLGRYCSEKCRDEAEETYHHVLCGASFESTETRVHPLHHLFNLCTEVKSSIPFFVARMFATVCQRIVAKQMSPEEATQDFYNFINSEDAYPGEDMALFLIRNIFAPFPFMSDIVTLSSVRRFISIIRRNAQTVSPVSDLHAWFENELKSEDSDALMKLLGFDADTLKDYMAKDEMTSLSSVHGSALLPVGNCANHSCDPNVIASSSHNDHRITFVAIQQIEEGQELLISYVDDNMEWKDRNSLLKEQYRFECTCMRCHVQKENIKIIE